MKERERVNEQPCHIKEKERADYVLSADKYTKYNPVEGTTK